MKKPTTMMLVILGALLSFPLMSGAQWAQTGGPKTDWVSALAVIGTNLFAGTEGIGVWRMPLSKMSLEKR